MLLLCRQIEYNSVKHIYSSTKNYTVIKRKGLTISAILLFALIGGIVAILIYKSITDVDQVKPEVEEVSQEESIKIERERIVAAIRADYDRAARANQSEDETTTQGESSVPIPYESFPTSVTYEQIAASSLRHSLQEVGWIPSWAYSAGINSLTKNKDQFTHVSPVWYAIDDSGVIIERTTGNKHSLLELSRDEGILVIPTVTCFDFKDFHLATNSEEKLQQHIDHLVNLVMDNNYDGIDLDYESIELVDKSAFEQIVIRTAEKLHARDKIFSVTVLSKWGDHVFYPSFRETRAVQDWSFIAKHADQVRIMSYDFTHPSSSTPGPIAPTDWMIAVVEYAVKKVPRDKLWLGIHLYSYEWSTGDKSHSYFYETVKTVIGSEGVETIYDKQSNEAIASYTCADGVSECILYYPTPESVEARKNIAKYFRLAGVAYWSLGKDGDLLAE